MNALFLAAVLMTADAAPRHVTVEPLGIDNFSMGFTGGSFDVKVAALRDRWLPIRLKELEYEVLVADKVFSSGTQEYDKTILRRGEPEVIPFHVKFTAAQALHAGASAWSQGKVKVRIRGTANVSVLFIPFEVDFNEKVNLGKLKKPTKTGAKKKKR
ncbi:MAG: LEA type 2 family protein [Myxococcota bacterium]